jgi:hypothetical protein
MQVIGHQDVTADGNIKLSRITAVAPEFFVNDFVREQALSIQSTAGQKIDWR